MPRRLRWGLFVKNCRDAEALDKAYSELMEDYPYFVKQAQIFAELHIANGVRSVPCMVSTIKPILHGNEGFPYKTLEHKPPCSYVK